MSKIFDKLLLLFFCVILFLKQDSSYYAIVPIILVTIFSLSIDISKNVYYKITMFIAYLVICIFSVNLIYFLPILCYDILNTKYKYLNVLCLVVTFAYVKTINIYNLIFIVIYILLAYYLTYITLAKENLKKDLTKLRDSYQEATIMLSNKNKELIKKQDYEINIATLKERNRISGEIHDNIGHLLSSSILQIGALISKNKDTELNENLQSLKSTLSTAMDNIRASVHNMYDEYIDLEKEIRKLVNDFNFCDIYLDYSIKMNPSKDIKYAFISIVKEALSNIIKHSNATKVRMSLTESFSSYQLIISDNGTNKNDSTTGQGMGIQNMIDRVTSFNGIININNENGYYIFISIPKTDIRS